MSRIYSFIAGISDFYFLNLLLGALVAFGVSLTQQPTSLLLIPILLLSSLTFCVLYYTLFAKSTLWLTPGENLAGRVIQDGSKVWINPYKVNRWALFLILLLTLIFAGNLWDRLGEGYIYSFTEVLIRALILIVLSYGLVSIGRGQLRGFLYPIAFYLFMVRQTLNTEVPVSQRGTLIFFANFLIGVAALHGIVALIYYLLRRLKTHNSS